MPTQDKVFFVEFLKKAVPAGDEVTQSFIECMVPEMVDRYVTRSAKGGAHEDDTHYAKEVRHKFEMNADQSISKTIPNKGGVEYRWFWLGACYLRDILELMCTMGRAICKRRCNTC